MAEQTSPTSTSESSEYGGGEESYEGEMANGMRNGRGVYKFASGGIYEGQYSQNRKNGEGKLMHRGFTEEPCTYIGEYSSGYRERGGVFYYSNGDKYNGEWHKGYKHGVGCYTFSIDNSKLIGRWKYGKIEHGKWILNSGPYFEGIFHNNKPTMKGVWMLPNGNQVITEYTHLPSNEVDGQSEMNSSLNTSEQINAHQLIEFDFKQCTRLREV